MHTHSSLSAYAGQDRRGGPAIGQNESRGLLGITDQEQSRVEMSSYVGGLAHDHPENEEMSTLQRIIL